VDTSDAAMCRNCSIYLREWTSCYHSHADGDRTDIFCAPSLWFGKCFIEGKCV